jgi:hypothetical protein
MIKQVPDGNEAVASVTAQSTENGYSGLGRFESVFDHVGYVFSSVLHELQAGHAIILGVSLQCSHFSACD